MKSLKYIISFLMAVIFLTACEEGIDPIKPLNPGQDTESPVITITSPAEGQSIYELEQFATVVIRGEVQDDIELESVTLSLDNKELITYKEFKDYRRLVFEYTYTQLPTGAHVLTVTGKDKSGKTSSSSINFAKDGQYKPTYNGEIFYMPFDNSLKEMLSDVYATKIGSIGFSTTGKIKEALAGAADSYLSFPTKNETAGINMLYGEFSAVFWYKINATPDRAGILTASPGGLDDDSSRKFGFRFFREAGNGGETFKLNAGNGNADSWFDGGANATLLSTADWTFIAFTISGSECAIYFNGQPVNKGAFTGIDWTGCNSLTILSGAPNFSYWGHNSDESLMDELRIFNKALTQQEIQKIMDDTK
jgi:hypothetical protein